MHILEQNLCPNADVIIVSAKNPNPPIFLFLGTWEFVGTGGQEQGLVLGLEISSVHLNISGSRQPTKGFIPWQKLTRPPTFRIQGK